MSTTTPARFALGLVALAAERMRGNAAQAAALATAVGLLDEANQAVRAAAGQVAGPTTRATTIGLRRAARLPGASRLREPALRVSTRALGVAAAARERGQQTVAASRTDATAAVQSALDEALRWLAPRILQRSLPEVRARLLPVVVEQLTTDARLREFLAEQTRLLVESAEARVSRARTVLAR